jgi:hypothetical protein
VMTVTKIAILEAINSVHYDAVNFLTL